MPRFCKYCGNEVRTNSKFCPFCGKELTSVKTEEIKNEMPPEFCPKCGKKIKEGVLFCANCGNPVYKEQGVKEAETVKVKKAEKKKSGKIAIPIIAGSVAVIGVAALLVIALIVGIIIAVTRPKKPGNGGNPPGGNIIAENSTGGGLENNPSRENLDEEYEAIDTAFKEGLYADDYPTEAEAHAVYSWYYDSEDDWMQQEGVEEQTVELPKGNSKAFSISPVEGVTISADEDALDHDREFHFTEVDEARFEELNNSFFMNLGGAGMVLNAWELDAGLGDDEVLPGTFTMTFDMDKLGLEEEDYPAFQVYRLDQNGNWYEYAIEFEGNEARVESAQNCPIIAVIGWGLIINTPGIIQSLQGYVSDAYFNPFTGVFDIYDKDKKAVIQVMLDRESFIKDIKDANQEVYYNLDKDARRKAFQQMQAENSSIESMKDIDSESLKKRYKTLYAKALKKNIEENADYRRIKENIEEYQAKAENDLEAVSKTCEHAINAWYFLKNQNVKMPNYKLRIELVKGAKAYATTVTPMFVGNPYVCVYMGQIAGGTQKEYDMLLVTLCHEMLHVVQREYVSKKRANFTFDEMTAADIEEKACDYFIEKGIIETPKEILLEVTLGQVGWFALPLDATTETYPEGSISNYSFSKTKEAEAAYPRSAFITYIREVSPPAEEEYSSVLNLYRMKWFAGVTSLIKNNFFHINTEEELTQAWHAFSQYYQTKFYEEAHKGLYDKSSDYIVFAPKAEIGENKDKQQVVLNNKDYTIRVRRIRANQPANQDYAKEYALVLKYNDDYRKNMETNGDFKITPLGTSEKVKYEEWENGLYFEPTEYSEKTEKVGGKEDSVLYNYDYYLMEADGGTEEKGFFGNPSDSGYALYALRNPEKPVTSVKDGILTVQLKDIHSEDRAEVVDSYVVTILCNGEDVFHRQVMLGDVTTYSYINANELERNGSQLSEEDKANLQLIIQECVTGTYSDGKGMYGPKSEPVAIDLSTKEKQTGTGDGYWQQTAVYQQMGSRTESGTYRREDITNQTTTYTVSSGHYEYETTYNINGETANHQFVDVTIPPEKIEPGDEIEFRSTGGDLTLDIDIVWDAEIKNGNDYSGTYFRQGTTTNEENLYRTPSEKGKTGKMVICYRDSLSKMITVFLYDWTEE